MKRKYLSLLIILVITAVSTFAQQHPKREFRGAWLHTVGQGQYAKMTTAENKAYLIDQLNKLQTAGCNAVVFQVRPCADAFYKSQHEPWSRYLTGTPGKAPVPFWDPLAFMIDECHKRNMELHAWLNPYRVTSSKTDVPAKNSLYSREPERFLTYDGKIYFDPGLPENRDFIVDVVDDIITNYDVDAIHMDDYFYPYPVADMPFPDDASYKKYGNNMEIGDWRRENVNLLIESIHDKISEQRPWIRFGISPFGVWRNKKDDERGSDTNALTNYDQLYADVTLWTEKGWVDYMVPQLYWELEHQRASSEILAYWWNDVANGRHMYIGQDITKTMDKADIAPNSNQLLHKIQISRYLDNIHGNCWWPGYAITKNYKGIAEELGENYQSVPALIPAYTFINDISPDAVTNLHEIKDSKGVRYLQWKPVETADEMQRAHYYVIYAFTDGDKIDIENAENIIDITRNTKYELPSDIESATYTYIVTAVDRMHNESAGSTIVVKF